MNNAREMAAGRLMNRAGGRWFDIQNSVADAPAVVRIYDEISFAAVNAADFAREMAAVDAADIRVEINSPGGNVFDGVAIYNVLRTHPAHITTRVDGLAASAASFIAQAGDMRLMMSGAQMMIHDAWGGCVGSAADMLEMASVLEQQNAVIAGIYAERSGRTPDAFVDLMSAETWMTADEAVEVGLADQVFSPERSESVAVEASGVPDVVAAAEEVAEADVVEAEVVEAEHTAPAVSDADRVALLI